MITEQKKLEELMYVSLVGKFDYKHIADNMTYLCYTSNCKKETTNKNIKPVYITGLNVVSDRTAIKRIEAFENKLFAQTKYLENLKNNKIMEDGVEKICFSKRIKEFITLIYLNSNTNVQKNIVNNYKNNMICLKQEDILDKEQFEAAVEFVCKQFNRINENIH